MFYLKVLKGKPFDNGQHSELQRNDCIYEVNGKQFVSFNDFLALKDSDVNGVVVSLLRNGAKKYMTIPSSVGLGAVLVEVLDDNSLQELQRESAQQAAEEKINEVLQDERNRVENETPKRLKHVLIYYVLLGFVVLLYNADVITLPAGRYRGLGLVTLLAFVVPLFYLVLGKRVFK